MATDGSAKNNLALLVGGAAAAMVALVVGATLFMGHVASPQSPSAQANATGGNFFNFSTALSQRPHRAPAEEATPAATPSPRATLTPLATPSPTQEQLVAQRKKRALALHDNQVEATPSAVALENSVTHSDVSVAPLGSRPLHVKPIVLATEVPLNTQPAAASTPQAPAATAVQVASAPQQAAAVYAPGTILDARFISRQEPVYPEIAREQDARGTAIVLVTIGPRGNVLSARVSQSTGFQMLDNAALDAAHGSSFQPPVIDGKAATATYRITYDFAP
jgi:TonB family protein